ncbi:zf-HC2 domain-containing protein [Actinocrispum sp. NPDC049592]|uniref:anti-sigma factor family protein n=1 Tax=Actinocrispum sp. NPDC049592 TaxID=3154835 RepID=UPI0034456F02
MTDLRGWNLPEQHLLPDAIVAFVDGELSPSAHARAMAHMQGCPSCATEIAAQRQARARVRTATTPTVPLGLLAALQAIPQNTELPELPDELAMTADGQLVAVQRPDRAGRAAKTPLGSQPLGSGPRLGQGPTVLGRGRRTAQGAGVVVSGLMLGALAFVAPSGTPAASTDTPRAPRFHHTVPAAAPVLVAPGAIVR